MYDMLRRRLRDDEEGFTLIELMVVVLIIAILIAIAIPTFLGAQNRARDRGAQSDLRNALTASKVIATDSAGAFVGTLATFDLDMAVAEPSLTYGDMAAVAAGTVKVGVLVPAGGATIMLERVSASGTWFGVSATKDGTVKYCRGADAAACDTAAKATLSAW